MDLVKAFGGLVNGALNAVGLGSHPQAKPVNYRPINLGQGSMNLQGGGTQRVQQAAPVRQAPQLLIPHINLNTNQIVHLPVQVPQKPKFNFSQINQAAGLNNHAPSIGTNASNNPVNRVIDVYSHLIGQPTTGQITQQKQQLQKLTPNQRVKFQLTDPTNLKANIAALSGGNGEGNVAKGLAKPLAKGATQLINAAKTAPKIGNPGIQQKLGINLGQGLDQASIDSLKRLSGGREAAQYTAKAAGQQFAHLGADGTPEATANLNKYLSGDRSGGLQAVQDLMDQFHQTENAAGISSHYVDNYLSRPGTISGRAAVSGPGKTLGRRPGFTQSRTAADEQAAQYPSIQAAVEARAGAHEKAMADAKFFAENVKNGNIAPTSSAPAGYKVLDPERSPTFQTKSGGESYHGTYSAPKQFADSLNNYLKSEREGIMGTISTPSQKAKGLILKTGIRGATPHGYNIGGRVATYDTANSGHYIASMADPKKAADYFNANLDDAARFTKEGAHLKYSEGIDSSGAKSGFGPTNDTFGKVIPAAQLRYMQGVEKQMISQGVDAATATRKAAEDGNRIFDTIKPNDIFRSKDLHNFLNTVFFAPNYLQTKVATLGRNALNAVKHPVPTFLGGNPQFGADRAGLVKATLGAQGVLNAANLATSGHLALQNSPGHEFSWDTGQKDSKGKEIYVNPPGTDQVKTIANAVSNPIRELQNVLSPPLSVANQVLQNKDFTGQKIYGKNISNTQAATNLGSVALGGAAPAPVSAGFDAATGKTSLPVAAARGVGLPVSAGSNSVAAQSTPNLFGQTRNPQAAQQLTNTALAGSAEGRKSAEATLQNQISQLRKGGAKNDAQITKLEQMKAQLRGGQHAVAKQNDNAIRASLNQNNGNLQITDSKIFYRNASGNIATINTKSSTTSQKNTAIKNVFQLLQNQSLSQQDATSVFKKMGVTAPQAETIYAKHLNATDKGAYILDKLQSGGNAVQLAKDGILTTSVAGTLRSNGDISQEDYVKLYQIAKANTPDLAAERKAAGIGVKPKKLPKVPSLKLTKVKSSSIKFKGVSTPKAKAAKFKTYKQSTPKTKQVVLA